MLLLTACTTDNFGNMSYSLEDKTIALAGIFQATHLVKNLAWEGKTNEPAMCSSLETLLRFDVPDVLSVYGDLSGIVDGLRTLKHQLTNPTDRDVDVTRYAITLIHLERKIAKTPAILNTITQRLEVVNKQLDYFDLTHENTIAKLAEIYKDTISTIQPRIIVQGEQAYLSNKDNANKIRALLLAGIRSAVLWRQCGGSRWQILFSRKKYLRSVETLLAKI